MKKINHNVLSLPPYISTSWKNINTLHMKEIDGKPTLVVVLHNGSAIEIPNLEPTVIEQVFAAHGKHLEQDTKEPQNESLKQYEPSQNGEIPFSLGLPFQMGGSAAGAMDNFGAFLHHNSEQSDTPDLPPEVLNKITSISKTLGMELDQMSIPKAEPHCNCTFCQISKAIHSENPSEEKEVIEDVSDQDLKFRDWEITQKGDQLYEVTNPLDKNEHYKFPRFPIRMHVWSEKL